jgi:hypothetical protein
MNIDSYSNYETNYEIFTPCDVEYPQIGFDDSQTTAFFHQK